MIRLVPPIFEKSVPGRKGYSLPKLDVPKKDVESIIPHAMLRKEEADLPEVSEVDVVRHFTRLSQLNYAVDEGLYPLGSCTMKYNPKLNEDMAKLTGFSEIHPLQDTKTVQGALALIYELSEMLAEITGMKAVSLQPAAGAHGELTGNMIIKAYHQHRGYTKRTKMIVPDTAHGTNPASAAVAGFEVIEVKSNERGNVDIEALKALMSDEIAGIMLTNPNTLGLFEEDILEIAKIIHDAGGLLYYDGANANAILGKARPGDMGFDVIHLNLHKSFSTPHGGGGPGSGPVGVCEKLVPFLPSPLVVKNNDNTYDFDYDRPLSIGKVRSFYGNFGVLVRAYTYIRTMGPDGLRAVAENAVLNANYAQAMLKKDFVLDFDRICKHEFVLSGKKQHNEFGVSTLDMAKRLMDYGFHPSTVYFPHLVEEAIMIEPPETESKEEIDAFIQALLAIAKEAEEKPECFKDAPYCTIVSRLDETQAARKPVLRWQPEEE
ncbi:MAG TPA: aminomethyl-transferring glycine dehydrogenase subunit GcvPB [Aminobacterium sp.]|jgi:glycine dehydrogenase subunit 2|uniref:aminomethyl-transferring glycine dehydrogenase subunit GcvPB n=1 Tax=Aminobacterium TaxID=81466 RepID=UPI000EE02752|nr:aminomethyl-transferring glycine dehydrogenase subunit GcvPB [Aminobacterium sp. UBA4834]HCA40796.1 aminomethyl-transferring glycine dehydrogenase subunit GcvPB [Aminobacterium sp.]